MSALFLYGILSFLLPFGFVAMGLLVAWRFVGGRVREFLAERRRVRAIDAAVWDVLMDAATGTCLDINTAALRLMGKRKQDVPSLTDEESVEYERNRCDVAMRVGALADQGYFAQYAASFLVTGDADSTEMGCPDLWLLTVKGEAKLLRMVQAHPDRMRALVGRSKAVPRRHEEPAPAQVTEVAPPPAPEWRRDAALTRVLVAQGLGDSHWVLMRLRSLLDATLPGWSNRPLEVCVSGSDRAVDYLRRVPWVSSVSVWSPVTADERRAFAKVWDRLCDPASDEDHVLAWGPFDLVVCLTGRMTAGKPWERLLGGATVERGSFPALRPDDLVTGRDLRAKRGRYVCLFLVDLRRFNCWTEERERVQRDFLRALPARFPDLSFVLTGREWDADFSRKLELPIEVTDLCGRTSTGQLLGLALHAEAWFGWCAGNGVVAQHLGCPTAMVWSRTYYPTHDRGVGSWERPGVPHAVLDVEDATVEGWLDALACVLEAGKGQSRPDPSSFVHGSSTSVPLPLNQAAGAGAGVVPGAST